MGTDINSLGLNHEPGSASYSPSYTERDDVIMPRTRTTQKRDANDTPGIVHSVGAENLRIPSPSTGGEAGQYDQLGFSTGFRAMRRLFPFTGRVITAPSMGAHPRIGHVGYTTRSQRLKNGVESLLTDSTPNSTAVAQEIVRTM